MTVEGNSTSFTQEKLVAVREAGAPRVSIGVQSFDKRLAGLMATPHDPDDRQVRLTPLGKLWSGRVCGTLLGPRHLLRLLSLKVMSEVFGRLPEHTKRWLMERAGRG